MTKKKKPKKAKESTPETAHALQRELRDPKYRQRRVKDKTKYNRKKEPIKYD